LVGDRRLVDAGRLIGRSVLVNALPASAPLPKFVIHRSTL
jgi:hypothetical protein